MTTDTGINLNKQTTYTAHIDYPEGDGPIVKKGYPPHLANEDVMLTQAYAGLEVPPTPGEPNRLWVGGLGQRMKQDGTPGRTEVRVYDLPTEIVRPLRNAVLDAYRNDSEGVVVLQRKESR